MIKVKDYFSAYASKKNKQLEKSSHFPKNNDNHWVREDSEIAAYSYTESQQITFVLENLMPSLVGR